MTAKGKGGKGQPSGYRKKHHNATTTNNNKNNSCSCNNNINNNINNNMNAKNKTQCFSTVGKHHQGQQLRIAAKWRWVLGRRAGVFRRSGIHYPRRPRAAPERRLLPDGDCGCALRWALRCCCCCCCCRCLSDDASSVRAGCSGREELDTGDDEAEEEAEEDETSSTFASRDLLTSAMASASPLEGTNPSKTGKRVPRFLKWLLGFMVAFFLVGFSSASLCTK